MAKIDFILNNLPDVYDKTETSNFYKFLSSFGSELDAFTEEVEKAKSSRFIDTATGTDLDKLGELVNLRRFFGETDDNFRGRVKSKVPSFIGGGAISAIRQVIKSYLGVEPSIIEHYVPGDGHPYFDNGVIVDSNVVVDSGLTVKTNPGVVYIGGNRLYPEYTKPSLNNLLGSDGNCEDPSKFSATGDTVSLDSTKKTQGRYSIKATKAATTSYTNFLKQITPSVNDCYIIIGDTYLETAADDIYMSTVASGVVAQSKNVTPSGNASYAATTIDQFVPIIRCIRVTNVTTPGTSYFSPRLYHVGKLEDVYNMDSVRVYKITQEEYDAFSTNIDLQTAINIAAKYPYIDNNNLSNTLTLPANTTTYVYMNSQGGLFYRSSTDPLPNQAILAEVTTNATSVTNITDMRVFLDPYQHYITNTASITIQIPYNFNETSVISLEDTRQILKETKAAGVAFLMSVFGSYEESLSLSDNVSFRFQVGFSGMGTSNYL